MNFEISNIVLRVANRTDHEKFVTFSLTVMEGNIPSMTINGWGYGPNGLVPPKPYTFRGVRLDLVTITPDLGRRIVTELVKDARVQAWVDGDYGKERK